MKSELIAPVSYVGPITRSTSRALAEKDFQEQSDDCLILKYTNLVFNSTSFFEAKEDVQTSINETLLLLDVDSASSHEEKIEEKNNSTLFL